jgi:DUF971 family protein
MTDSLPTDIKAKSKSAVLEITWNDGEICVYPYDLLRNACPCAQCRGGHENMHPEPQDEVMLIPLMDAKASRLEMVTPVGNYAINLAWEDGHTYGIYNWRFLKSLCAMMKSDEK